MMLARRICRRNSAADSARVRFLGGTGTESGFRFGIGFGFGTDTRVSNLRETESVSMLSALGKHLKLGNVSYSEVGSLMAYKYLERNARIRLFMEERIPPLDKGREQTFEEETKNWTELLPWVVSHRLYKRLNGCCAKRKSFALKCIKLMLFFHNIKRCIILVATGEKEKEKDYNSATASKGLSKIVGAVLFGVVVFMVELFVKNKWSEIKKKDDALVMDDRFASTLKSAELQLKEMTKKLRKERKEEIEDAMKAMEKKMEEMEKRMIEEINKKKK